MKKIADMMAAGWDLESRDQHGSNALLWAAGKAERDVRSNG